MATEAQLTSVLKDVVQEIRIQSLTKHVRQYHGEGSAKFTNWLTDMDQLATTCDSERMCVLATLTLGGMAGTYTARVIQENPGIQWADLRKKLRERFSEVDAYMARERCRRLRQNKGESVQNFGERLLAAAREAFDNVNEPEVQQILVETFQKGVSDDRLARKLIRKRFDTLERAVEFASEEQVAERTFEMYRSRQAPEEPMEVDVVQTPGTEESLGAIQKSIQELNSKLERVAKQVRRPNKGTPPVHQVPLQQTPSVPKGPGPDFTVPPPPFVPAPVAATKYRWTDDGRPICAACGRIGHVQRRCRFQKRGN